MELKMENETNIFRKERFNLRVAQQAYRMSMSTDAERYLLDIKPVKKEPRPRPAPTKEKTSRSIDFSDLAQFI
jgi:hypothetical protein